MDQGCDQLTTVRPVSTVEGHARGARAEARDLLVSWLTAFPDSRLSVESIRRRGQDLYDVDLIAVGTHLGTLTCASWIVAYRGGSPPER